MIAEIIGVGGDLTDPEQLRRFSLLLLDELGGCDVRLGATAAAGTNVQRLRGAVSKALGRADIVFLIGGMGASEEDITKATVCEGLGRRLVLHQPSLERIRAAYERAGRQMPRPIAKLAMMPEESVVFPGARGLTPGCALSAGQQFILMLPASEKELVPMVRASVVPYLAKFSSAALGTRAINVFGKSAADVKQAIRRYLAMSNPTVTVEEKDAETRVLITTRAKSKSEASALSEPVIKAILGLLGDSVYGVDQSSLQNVVIGALRANRITMAVGEAGTDGLLTRLLEKIPSSESAFPFGVTANSQRNKQDALKISEKLLKKHDAVSEQIAVAMADGARVQGETTVGIGITGEESKKNVLFYVAVCDRQSAWVKKLSLPKATPYSQAQYLACLTALDLARRVIAALPARFAGANPLELALSGKIPQVLEGEAVLPDAKGRAASKKQRPVAAVGGGAAVAAPKRGFFASVFPARGDSAGEVMRKLILWIAIIVFVVSGVYLGNFYYQSYHNKALTAEISDMYIQGMGDNTTLTVPDDYPSGYQKKFANLYAINEDVAGWIKIPDTQISYPVVQYVDNIYYNRRDFYRQQNQHGVPWLEYRSTLEPQADNYVIYGHNMADGQMFGELMKYKPTVEGLDFLQKHPIITMDDVYRDNEYKIMAVFITNAKEEYGDIFYYNYYTDLSDKTVFDEFVSEVTARSYYTSDVDVKHGDQFITLSTCSYEYGPVSADAHVRTVVVGRRLRPGEKSDGSSIEYHVNPTPKMPTGFTGGKSGVAQSQSTQTSSALAVNAGNAVLPGASASASQPASSVKSSSGLTQSELEELAYESQQAAKRKLQSELEEQERLEAEAEERRISREESRRESETAARLESERELARQSSEEAARRSSEEAVRLASEEAVRLASEEAARKSSEEAARQSSEEAARLASEEAARKSSEEAARSSSEALQEQSSDTTVLSAMSNEKLSITSGGKKISASAADLIPQVVMNEMGASFSDEALKAQAVAAYTFVKQQNQSGVIPALGMKTPSARVKNLCDEVLGQAVYYKDKLAFTPFYATSAGVSIASKDVWGGSYPYLVSVDSWVDELAPGYESSVTYSAAEVARRVKNALGVDLNRYSSDPNQWFEILGYADGGDRYVSRLSVGDKTVTGRSFRESVMGLRSAAFDISYNARADAFTFTAYGYGHGVGMSQNGAQLFWREEGWDYVQILEHYYPGTKVK